MIQIQVVTYEGMPPVQSISASFDELGGNIGRSDGNALVLNDPGRSISRIHASVVCRGGKYFIRGLGSTMPVYLNEQLLNNGQDTLIVDGDRIRIGGYVMQIMDHDSSSSRGSFEPAMQQPLAPANDYSDNNLSLTDLLALPEEQQAKQDPMASKAETSDSIAQDIVDPFASNAVAAPKQAIPPDFDLFAMPSNEENKLVEMASSGDFKHSDDFSSMLESKERQPSIDDVINSSHAIVDLPASASKGSIDDPLVALDNAANDRKMNHAVQRDDVSELNSSLPPMRVYDKDAETPAVSKPAAPAGVPLSHQEELLQAFLSGAGLSNLDKPIELTPQLMNQIGQLLRVSTQGTLDLLLARALMKREMRAEMTMIRPRENNPLKLSPNVEVALMHLLAPKAKEQGFMPPLQAVKDAYNDLRSHQFGFMAGMRSALSGILYRFNPNQLEKRLGQKTLVDSVFSLNRKANLWNMFTDRYDDISHEAEEDFHVMFSKEFLKAYEAQIAKLEMEDKKR
ncbi:MAG: type VI secretion system-associated FHA domain protein TagH [Proteobacteria bacterium]|nr:type VI secretion system-associated FHA domain protein TagH [Pseudomonadota bacterium]